jgi:hypothetical protein
MIILLSCSNNSTRKNNFGNNIQLSNVTLVPLNKNSSNQLIIQFNNNLNKDLSNSKFKIINDKNLNDNNIDASNCKIVNAGNSCLIKINFPKDIIFGSFILQASADDYKTSQVIKYDLLDDEFNNYTLGMFTKNLKVPYGSKFSINIPFKSKLKLESAYININGQFDFTNSRIICNNNIKTIPPNQLCNAIIEGIANDKTFFVEIIGYNNNKIIKSNTENINITNQTSANIIPVVTNKIFSPENNLTISFLNNGNQSASNLTISPLMSNETIITNSCTGIINANSTCSITIQKSGGTSGNRTFYFTYNNGSKIDTNYFNSYYQTNSNVPALNMELISGDLYTTINTQKTLTIRVTNYGSTTINSIEFSNQSKQNVNMQYDPLSSCIQNRGYLLPNTYCTLFINYQPTTAERNFLKVYAKINYTTSSGDASYTNTQLVIEYTSNKQLLLTLTKSILYNCELDTSGQINSCSNNASSYGYEFSPLLANIGSKLIILTNNGYYQFCELMEYGLSCDFNSSRIDQLNNLTYGKVLKFNNVSYLYFLKKDNNSLMRCYTSLTNKSIDNCESITNVLNFKEINTFDISNGYIYFPTYNNSNNVFICQLNNYGRIDIKDLTNPCPPNNIGDNLQSSIIFTTINNTKYAYLLSNSKIIRCNYKSPDIMGGTNHFSNCVSLKSTSSYNPINGLSFKIINNHSYLYYIDDKIYRTEIYSDGSISDAEYIELPPDLGNNVAPIQISLNDLYSETKIDYLTENWYDNAFSILPGYVGYQYLMDLNVNTPLQLNFTSSNSEITVGQANFTNNTFQSFSIYATPTTQNVKAKISVIKPKITLPSLDVRIERPIFLLRSSTTSTNYSNYCTYDQITTTNTPFYYSICPKLPITNDALQPLDYAIYRDINNQYYILISSFSQNKIFKCKFNPQMSMNINSQGQNNSLIDSNCQSYDINGKNVTMELKKFKDNQIFLYVTNVIYQRITRFTINQISGELENSKNYDSLLINKNRGVKISPNESYIYIAKVPWSAGSNSAIVRCNLDTNHDIITNTCGDLSFYTGSSPTGNTINLFDQTTPYNLDFANISGNIYVYFASTDGPNQQYMAINKCRMIENTGDFVECKQWKNNNILSTYYQAFTGIRMISVAPPSLYFTDADSNYISGTKVIKSFSLDYAGDIYSYQSINYNNGTDKNFPSQVEGVYFANSVN